MIPYEVEFLHAYEAGRSRDYEVWNEIIHHPPTNPVVLRRYPDCIFSQRNFEAIPVHKLNPDQVELDTMYRVYMGDLMLIIKFKQARAE